MSHPPASRPRAISAINRLGRGLQVLGLKVPSLDPRILMATASRRSGLEDFGDLSFIPALEVLVNGLESEARLSQIGRIATRVEILNGLTRRLQITDYRKQRPEVAEQRIERPLFVLGLPRTGTTILYELLAQDPIHRAPMSWEVAYPLPPAQAATFETDARIAKVDKEFGQLDRLAPGFKAMHEIGANLPQECVALFAAHFLSDQWSAAYCLPSYRRWSLTQDMSAVYRWHRQYLQHLQVDYARPRWVLKTPAHLAYLKALTTEYPDAAIVWTHRDPMDVMASLSSLVCTLRGAFSDHIDPAGFAAQEVEYFSSVLAMGVTQRRAMSDEASRFFDVSFRTILSDPLSAVDAIYRHFGFELSDHARDRMQRYLRARPRDKHGKHVYSPEQFGLSQQRQGALFSGYCEAFAAHV
jgi:hypothetical protein